MLRYFREPRIALLIEIILGALLMRAIGLETTAALVIAVAMAAVSELRAQLKGVP